MLRLSPSLTLRVTIAGVSLARDGANAAVAVETAAQRPSKLRLQMNDQLTAAAPLKLSQRWHYSREQAISFLMQQAVENPDVISLAAGLVDAGSLPVAETRREILRIHIAKRNRDPRTFDLEALAAASDGYSGAELEQVVITALHQAFDEGRGADLTTERILTALKNSPPLSVTMAERVQQLRAWARGRCVPADEV